MKKITLLFSILLTTSLFSQVVLQDFSNLTNNATEDVYGGFGGALTASATLDDDPDNASNKVRKVTTTAGGDVWKGVFFRPQTHYIDLTTTKTVSINVYSTTSTFLQGKIQAGQSGQGDVALTTSESHGGTGWETLTFTFSAATGEWAEFVLYVNVDASGAFIDPATEVLTAYFDDITAVQGSAIPIPASGVVVQDFSNLENIAEEEVYGGFGGNLVGTNALDDDPDNAANKVRKVTTTAGGDIWKGVFFRPQTHYMDLTTNKVVSIKVYSNTATFFKGKIQAGQSSQADIELTSGESHTGSGWETLTFTFSGATGEWKEFVLFTNVDSGGAFIDPATEALTAYFDDVTTGQGSAIPPAPSELTTPSPAISHSGTTGIISVYSDVLTNISGVDTNPNWSQSTATTEVDINGSGNNALKYANLNYQGTDFDGNRQDVSGMTHFHLDYYTENATALQFFLIDAGAEQAYDIAAGLGITTGSWQTLDIPLSTWSSLDLTTIRQFKVVGDGTIYFDNFYFYDSATATASVENNKLLELSMYPNPSSDILNISAANTITNAEIFNVIGKKVMSVIVNDSKASLDISQLTSGIYLIKYTVGEVTGTAKFIKK